MRQTTLQNSPIAFIVFNRPECTRRVFERIAQARPPQLFVIADGPRTDKPGEAELCEQTRAVIDAVDWECDVQTHFASENMGCKRRVASGLDWVFSQADRAIILEDDCLPDPGFFPFCEQMLERYAGDERVHMVRGNNLLLDKYPLTDSYYFSRNYNIWGWATWARAWSGYDVEMRRWPELRDSGWLESYLGDKTRAELVSYFCEEVYTGRMDTWDYQWLLAGWLRDALAIVPACNMISNIGFGANATHTADEQSLFARLEAQAMSFPLSHPARVEADSAADEVEWRNVYPGKAGRRGAVRGLYRRMRNALLGQAS